MMFWNLTVLLAVLLSLYRRAPKMFAPWAPFSVNAPLTVMTEMLKKSTWLPRVNGADNSDDSSDNLIVKLLIWCWSFSAIKLDGCNVTAYTAWSLMDNFEWTGGYSATFGLHRVDFSDPTRARVPKASVSFYRQLIADNGWPVPKHRGQIKL